MTESPPNHATKSCSGCGFGNPSAAKFCVECGQRFSVAGMTVTAHESNTGPASRISVSIPTFANPRTVVEGLISSIAPEDAAARLRSSIETSRVALKALGVPLPKAENPILLSLMESLKALPSTEISARIAIVTALGRMGDPAVLPPLLLVTGAQSKDVRKATAIALGCIKHPLSAYLLLPTLQDGSSRVRQAAFQALVQLNQPHTAAAILAACLGSKTLRALIVETLKLVSEKKRSAFFALLGDSAVNSQPELRIVADWLRYELRNVASHSDADHASDRFQSMPISQTPPQNEPRPQEKPVQNPEVTDVRSMSPESDIFEWSGSEKFHSDREESEAISPVTGTRHPPAAAAEPRKMFDRYEMSSKFVDDDEENDVRLVDDIDHSAEDLKFFNTISQAISQADGHVGSDVDNGNVCLHDERQETNSTGVDYSEYEFASNGSQALMSLSGMLAPPEKPRQSGVQTSRPVGESHYHNNQPSDFGRRRASGSPQTALPSFPIWAQDTSTAMGNTPVGSQHHLPLMQSPGVLPQGPSTSTVRAGTGLSGPAFDKTPSSLVPAFTSTTVPQVDVTATMHAAGHAGAYATSTDNGASGASITTNIVMQAASDKHIDETELEEARIAEAREKSLARLRAAREVAFRQLLPDAETEPQKLPRLMTKRIAALMATPSTKIEQVTRQIRELGSMSSPAALSTLGAFSQKPAKQVREACADALGCIAHPGSVVLLIKFLSDKSGTVVEAAVKSLAKLDLEPTRPVLIAAGLCGANLRTVVTVSVESASDGKKAEWEKYLLEVLRGNDSDAAAFGVALLARVAGDTHLEIFQELASHKTPVLRAAAVDALARTQAKRAISQINNALEDTDPSVRAQAAMSVATMYSPRSVELLQNLLLDSDLHVRRNAAQSMSRIDEASLADAIARALDQETDATTVEYLLAALQRNGAHSSLPILQRYIEGEHTQFREQAVRALRKLKIPASIPVFRRLLDDHTPALRRHSIEQLTQLKSESVLPRLREMLKQDPDETVRSACAKALGDFDDATSVNLLEEALEDHPLVRLQAVIALGRLARTSTGPVLLSLLNDPLPEIRYQAVRGIGQLKLRDAILQIEPLLNDSDEIVRRGAEQTMKELGVTARKRTARQWKRRIATAAGWITPNTLAGLVPGGAGSLLATILVVVGLLSAVGVMQLRGAISGEELIAGKVGDVALNNDGSLVAVLRRTAVLDLWSVKEGVLKERVAVPRGTSSVFIEQNGGIIILNGKELTKLDAANLSNRETAPVLKFPDGPAELSFNRKTNSLYVFLRVGNAVKLKKIDCGTFREVKEFSIAAGFSGRGIVSPDESIALIVGGDGAMTICDLKSGQTGKASISRLVAGSVGSVYDMTFSSDMQYLAVCTSGSGVVVLKTDGMALAKNVPATDAFKPAALVFKDGSHDLTAVTPNGSVLVITGEFESQSQTDISGAPACGLIDVASDGKTVVLGQDDDKNVWLVSAEQKALLHELKADSN